MSGTEIAYDPRRGARRCPVLRQCMLVLGAMRRAVLRQHMVGPDWTLGSVRKRMSYGGESDTIGLRACYAVSVTGIAYRAKG
eukprot:1258850-Rhodomonas_salina.3